MTLTNGKIIGITGGIASGKSTFSTILREKGYIVIDADKISRSLIEKGSIEYKKIIEKFGNRILDRYGNINRKLLAKKIFEDKSSKKDLEDILHPPIFKEIKRLIDIYKKSKDIIFVDIPLLYEKKDKLYEYDIHLDEVWLIYVDKDTQIRRLIDRDKIDLEGALKKIDAQISMEEKKKFADKIIYNTDDLGSLKRHTEDILEDLN